MLIDRRQELFLEPFVALFLADAFRIPDHELPSVVRSVLYCAAFALEVVFPPYRYECKDERNCSH